MAQHVWKGLLAALLISLTLSDVQALESCCADLGCFNSGAPFFHPIHRPVITVPKCSIMSTFGLHLNTRGWSNVKVTQRMDPYEIPTIANSDFDVNKDTKLLIHGFTDLYDWPWWTDIVSALLADGDYNVIRFDWGKATVMPFEQSIADTRLAGAYVAKFVNILKDNFGYPPQRIHIISHSLGVHAAGYVGERVDKIGRITALDPGRYHFENTDPAVRLDPTDAEVVDSLVTDGENFPAFALGSLQPMAHITVYMNGGSRQPGCEFGTLFFPWGKQTNYNTTNYNTSAIRRQTEYQNKACSHWRAYFLFTETISRDKCQTVAYECDSYQQFKSGQCFPKNGTSTLVGYHVNTALAQPGRLRFFHAANDKSLPFCVKSFSLNFRLQSKTDNHNAKAERGVMSARLYGSLGSSAQVDVTSETVDLNPGSDYKFLFHIPHKELGVIHSMHISWTSRHNILLPSENMRKHILYFDGNFQLTNEEGQLTNYRPAKQQLEEKRDLLATAI